MHKRLFPLTLTIGGAIGLVAAAVITYDKNRLLLDPSYVPGCSLNPVISCGSVMKTAQASAFGFPNSWMGLVGFAMVLAVGVGLLAGANYKAWYLRLFNFGTLLAVGFVHWLMYQSIFNIHALCPWCMVVWTVTLPIFWFTTLHNLTSGNLWLDPASRLVRFVSSYKYLILLAWYLAIITMILVKFWYYFRTVF